MAIEQRLRLTGSESANIDVEVGADICALRCGHVDAWQCCKTIAEPQVVFILQDGRIDGLRDRRRCLQTGGADGGHRLRSTNDVRRTSRRPRYSKTHGPGLTNVSVDRVGARG